MEYKILANRWRSRKVGFSFDMYAWFKLCEMNDIEIHQLHTLPEKKMMGDLIYAAYVSYCTKALKKPKLSQESLGDLLDNMTKGQTEQLSQQILNAKVFGKSVKGWADGEKKKK